MSSTAIALKPVTVPEIVIDLGSQALLVKPAADALELAQAMTIDCQEMADQASSELTAWAKQADAIAEWRMGITRPINAAVKNVIDFARPAMDNYEAAAATLRNKVAAWQRAERDRLAREQAQREAEARAQRERMEAEAREQKRQADEAAALAAAKAREAQETQDASERARLQAESERAAQQAAEHLDDAANSAAIAQVIVAQPTAEAPKVAGMRFGDKAELEVDNKLALLAWIVANPQYVHLADANLPNLRALQKAQGDQFAVPGVKVTKTIAAGRTAKAA